MRFTAILINIVSIACVLNTVHAASKEKDAAGQPVVIDALAEAKAVNGDKRRVLSAKFRKGHVTVRKEQVKRTKTKTGYSLKFPSETPIPTPTVADGKLYVGGGFSSKEFYCFDAKTGKQIWAVNLDDDGPTSAVVAEGSVIINTESCTLFALDARTGKQQWSWYLGDPLLSAPTVANGRVYTVYPVDKSREYAKFDKTTKPKIGKGRSYTHALIAIELKTGKILWQRWVDTDCMTAPVVVGDDVLVTTLAGTLYRFRQTNGNLLAAWRMRATSAPIVVGDRLVLTCRADSGKGNMVREAIVQRSARLRPSFLSGSVLAPYLDRAIQIKADSTREAGKFEGGNGIGGGFGGGFSSGSGSGFGSGGGSGFFSIQPNTKLQPNGQAIPVNGRLPVKALKPGQLPDDMLVLTEHRAADVIGQGNVSMLQTHRGSRLLHYNGRLFNCMGDVLRCTDAESGKMLWKHPLKGDLKKLGGHLATAPIVAGDRLFVATLQGEVIEVSPKSGKVQRRHKVKSKLRFPPIVDSGRIFISTADGRVVCIDTKDAKLTGWPMPGRDAGNTRSTQQK